MQTTMLTPDARADRVMDLRDLVLAVRHAPAGDARRRHRTRAHQRKGDLDPLPVSGAADRGRNYNHLHEQPTVFLCAGGVLASGRSRTR